MKNLKFELILCVSILLYTHQTLFITVFFINNYQMNSYHYLFKFIVIGDSGVGKSCIVLQFIESKTRTAHDVTIGVQFGAKTIKIDNKNIKLQIWDTAGQQNFRSITRSYYRSAIGALLVYDITKRQSFQHVKGWLQQVKVNGNPHMEILLIGNKIDLELQRAVSKQEGMKFAKQNNLKFLQICAKDYEKVNEAFSTVTKNILTRISEGKLPTNSQNIGIKTGDEYKLDLKSIEKKKKGCC